MVFPESITRNILMIIFGIGHLTLERSLNVEKQVHIQDFISGDNKFLHQKRKHVGERLWREFKTTDRIDSY